MLKPSTQVHLSRDTLSISSLCIYIRLFKENVYCTYRIFKASVCKLLYLLLLNSIPKRVVNSGSS